jgi:pimeloyl-ACP methyl ester carboxylesterase
MQLRQRLVLKYIRTKFRLLSTISKKRAAFAAFRLFCTPQYRNRKKLPPVFEKAEVLNIKFEGFHLRGYHWPVVNGTKNAMILHGFESSVINFDRYVKPLMRKGYNVIAVDAPAHGRSSGRQITVPVYKKLIHYIDKRFGPVNAFIAHSLGGLALTLAMEEMDQNNRRMVLIAPAAETTTAIDTFFRFVKLDDEVRKEFDSLILQLGGHPPGWYSVTRAASNIHCPVLFLQDKDDDQTPFSDVEPLMQKHYPNWQFLITEGLGHRRIYRDNQCSKAIIDFL